MIVVGRYLITDNLDQAYAASGNAISTADASILSCHDPGITYSEHW